MASPPVSRASEGAGGGAVPCLSEHRGTATYYRINDARALTASRLPPTSSWAVPFQPSQPAHRTAKRSNSPAPPTPLPAASPVISHYSALARNVHCSSAAITDCEPDAFTGGSFGAAAYPEAADVPDGRAARQPRLRQPARRGQHRARPDRARGPRLRRRAFRRCCCPPAEPGPASTSPTDWTPAPTCSPSPAPTQPGRGIANAIFLPGRIEAIPLPDGHVDVIISNCVINLSADKPRVLAEAFRVLKPGRPPWRI